MTKGSTPTGTSVRGAPLAPALREALRAECDATSVTAQARRFGCARWTIRRAIAGAAVGGALRLLLAKELGAGQSQSAGSAVASDSSRERAA